MSTQNNPTAARLGQAHGSTCSRNGRRRWFLLDLMAFLPRSLGSSGTAQLKWWSDYCSRFMRSPEFLAAMRNSMAAVTESRKQANDMLGEMQHVLQGATREDIDRLTQRLAPTTTM